MPKTLDKLLAAVPKHQILSTQGDMSTVIAAAVSESSLDIKEGGLFAARKGQSADGHHYIDQALAAGASAVIGEIEPPNLPVPYVQVKNSSEVLGWLAAAYYDYPSRKLAVIGITGTDGKTTISHILHHILKQAGVQAGCISTLSADVGDETVETGLHVTTPPAPRVQAYLAQMAAAGLTHGILEMTSHGLAQGRLQGVEIDAAVLSNVMHEHLDFHRNWEDYRAAKAIMFRMLGRSWRKPGLTKISVINADDPSADYFLAIPADTSLRYGIHHPADYQAAKIHYQPHSTSFAVQGKSIETRLAGEFNVYNALAAISAARHLGVDWSDIQQGMASFDGVAGRMERIDEGQDFIAIVDFAHTPNALKRALQTGRAMLPAGKRLFAVFGSAGLRDIEKRRMMAETAADLADITILTAEDPRTESLTAILEMMAQGCQSRGGLEGETFICVPDRGQAIYQACQMARPGDLVMVCGKGHEQSMCFGTTEYAWDDRAATRSALKGKPLATLPTAKERC